MISCPPPHTSSSFVLWRLWFWFLTSREGISQGEADTTSTLPTPVGLALSAHLGEVLCSMADFSSGQCS